MKKEDLNLFLKKKVKLILKSGFHYTCIIESLNEETVHITDKFGEKHAFSLNHIDGVSELK